MTELRRRPLISGLEPRMMFDAAAPVTVAEAVSVADAAPSSPEGSSTGSDAASSAASHQDGTTTSGSISPAASAGGTQAHEIVFVDEKLVNTGTLPTPREGVEVVVLSGDTDGFAQITAALDGRTDISAIHLVTHGEDGQVDIGGSRITAETLSSHAADIAAWGTHLAQGADILIYGCDVAQDAAGQKLIEGLSSLTGADVAASSNTTGSGNNGGDWVLERSTGTIEASLFASDSALALFNGTLAANLTSGATTGWTAVTPANSQNDAIGDQQTGSGSVPQDIVGDATYRAAYVWYDNGGTAGNVSDDVISFRVRVNDSDGTAQSPTFGSFAFFGVDADLNGTVDFFSGIYNPTNNSGRIGVYDANGAGNTGPSDTGINGTPTVIYNKDTAGYSSMYSMVKTTDGSNFSGDSDYFISWSVKISDINAAKTTFGLSTNITDSTVLRYIVGTAAQDNAFNQDVSGITGSYSQSTQTWVQLGGFTPVLNMDGTTATLPTATISGITTDSGSSTSDYITTDRSLIYSGTASANSSVAVTLKDSGGTTVFTTTVTADGSGNWSVDKTATNLNDGTYTLTAVATASGVSSATATQAVIVDNAAPSVGISAISTDSGSSGTDFRTNDQTLTYSGTAEANSSVLVTLKDSGNSTVFTTTVIADGSGHWSVDKTGTTQADGSYTLTAVATDIAGNSSTAATQAVVIDTTAPAVAISAISTDSGGSSTDFRTNDQTLTYSGTTEANASVLVTLKDASNSTVFTTTVTADGSGHWSVDKTGTTQATGSYTLTAVATDTAGNSSTAATQAVVIDTTAPAVAISAISTDSGSSGTDFRTNDQTLTYSGTAEANSSVLVTLKDSGNNVVFTTTVTADGSGNWSVDKTAVTQAEGTYTLSAVATDTAGNSSAAATKTVIIDTTAPAVAISAISTDSGSSGTDFRTNDQTLTYSGTAEANSSVLVTLKDASNSTVFTTTVTADGSGHWSVDKTGTTQATGSYTLTAVATDATGNSSSPVSQAIVIDTTAPAVAISAISTDSGSSSTDFHTNDQTLVYSGTAEANSSVLVTLKDSSNSTVFTTTVTADGSGNWSVDKSEITQAAGTYILTAVATDAAGNSSTAATKTVVIDTTAPTAPTVSSQTATTTTPTITGTWDNSAGNTLSVTIDNVTYTTANGLTVNGGNWSLTIPGDNALTDGSTYPVSATTTDAAGNSVSDSSNNELVVNLASVATPTVTSLRTNDTTPTIAGTWDNSTGNSLSVVVNGVTYTTTNGLTTTGGNWSLTIPGSNTLTEGTYAVTATVTNATNQSATDTTTNELVIDTTAPTVAISSITTDSGGSSTDFRTNDQTLVYSGTTEANASVLVTLKDSNNTVVFTTTVTADGSGNWSVDKTGTTQAAGTYTLSAVATDTAGNSSTAATQTVVIDTTAPAVAISAISTDSGGSSTDFRTNDQTLTYSGTAEANSSVLVTLKDSSNTVVFTTTVTADGSGHWSVDKTGTTQADGSYTLTAVATDTAGNSSTAATQAVVIDTTAPAAPTVTLVTDSGSNTSDAVSNVGTLNVTGTESGATIQYSTDGGTTWTTSFTPVEGSNTVKVRQVDVAGNASPATTYTFTYDSSAPAPTVASQTTASTTPTVTGTWDSSSGNSLSVTINGVTYTTANGLVVDGGNWSLTIPAGSALTAGATYSVTATVTDVAGNTASDTSGSELVVSRPADPVKPPPQVVQPPAPAPVVTPPPAPTPTPQPPAPTPAPVINAPVVVTPPPVEAVQPSLTAQTPTVMNFANADGSAVQVINNLEVNVATAATSSTTTASKTEVQSYTIAAKELSQNGGGSVQLTVEAGLPRWMKVEANGDGILKMVGERPVGDDRSYQVIVKVKRPNGEEANVVLVVKPSSGRSANSDAAPDAPPRQQGVPAPEPVAGKKLGGPADGKPLRTGALVPAETVAMDGGWLGEFLAVLDGEQPSAGTVPVAAEGGHFLDQFATEDRALSARANALVA